MCDIREPQPIPYTIFGRCEFGVETTTGGILPEPDVAPCNELAVACINFGKSTLYVCQKHFDVIAKEIDLG